MVVNEDARCELTLLLDRGLILFLKCKEVVALHIAIRSDDTEAAVLLIERHVDFRRLVVTERALELANYFHLISADHPDYLLVSSEQVLPTR